MQDGLFDNPPEPIICAHRNCKQVVAYLRLGDMGRWRWVHVKTNHSQCFPSGTQWAKPADDTVCSRCCRPKPADWCWDGCRVDGECPLGFLARDIEESPQAVRDLHRGERAHARNTDPVTSHEAAESIGEAALRRSQIAVLSMFQRYGPMHDVDLVERYMLNAAPVSGLTQQSESGIRTRRRELVDQGVLEDSGEKALLPSGRRAIIWRIWKP